MKSFDEMKAAARARVKSYDKIDGFEERQLFTILCALDAGLRNPKSGAAFDALVMLEEGVHLKQSKK